jgi:hypothetical protein
MTTATEVCPAHRTPAPSGSLGASGPRQLAAGLHPELRAEPEHGKLRLPGACEGGSTLELPLGLLVGGLGHGLWVGRGRRHHGHPVHRDHTRGTCCANAAATSSSTATSFGYRNGNRR